MSNTRSKIEKQAHAAIVQYAFFRWENAVIIGGTLLLIFFLPHPFPGWPGWAWPVLGLFGVIIIVISSLGDVETRAKVQRELFQERFNPRKVRAEELRMVVEQALEHQQRMEVYIGEQGAGTLRSRLEDTATQITDWVAAIYQLALCLDAYRHDTRLAKERAAVGKTLEVLIARAQLESNVEVKQQLEQVIESKRKQRNALDALNRRMAQAERQLEQSVVALATACSRARSINTLNIQSQHADRLRQDIQEHIAQLSDLMSKINGICDYEESGN